MRCLRLASSVPGTAQKHRDASVPSRPGSGLRVARAQRQPQPPTPSGASRVPGLRHRSRGLRKPDTRTCVKCTAVYMSAPNHTPTKHKGWG